MKLGGLEGDGRQVDKAPREIRDKRSLSEPRCAVDPRVRAEKQDSEPGPLPRGQPSGARVEACCPRRSTSSLVPWGLLDD